MKSLNIFFKKRKKTYLYDILQFFKIKNKKSNKNIFINDIKPLDIAKKNDITFLHTSKYKHLLSISKSNFVITNHKLSKLIHNSKTKIVVDNVLISVSKLTEFLYPESLNEQLDVDVISINKKKKI